MTSITTSNTIVRSRPGSASSEYDAKSKLDVKDMLRSIAGNYSEREEDNMEEASVYERYDQIEE